MRATDPPSPQTRRAFEAGDGSVSVLVSDEQEGDAARPVDVARWERLVREILADLGVAGDAELSLRFVDPPEMAGLNERFMGKVGPTDVLSFPIDGALPVGGGSLPGGPPVLLGDIVICPEVAERNAPGHAGSYEDELALLCVHGTLHLLGMDHAEPAERAEMWAQERELLERFWGAMARDPWSS